MLKDWKSVSAVTQQTTRISSWHFAYQRTSERLGFVLQANLAGLLFDLLGRQLRNLCAILTPLLSAALALAACRRAGSVAADTGPIAKDSGPASPDAGGTIDAGPDIHSYFLCPSDAVPPSPEDGGLTWHSELAPTPSPPQDGGWVATSTDPECAALTPGSVPPRFSWKADAGLAACDWATVDGKGNLAVTWSDGHTAISSYLPIDGSAAAAVHNGKNGSDPVEDQVAIAPRGSGFFLLSRTWLPWCHFARPMTPAGSTGPASVVISPYPDIASLMRPNPLGGYVEARTTSDGQQPRTETLDVRFVNEALQPLGDWHSVVTYHEEIYWDVEVDQQGRALVLAFMYPPSFGQPAPPGSWTFAARWMGPSGALTDEFQPVAPIFRPDPNSNGSTLFAGYGVALPLPEGGFVMFHGQVDASTYHGSISPTGWYAHYASGQTGSDSAPAWLQLYSGYLRPLAGGLGYAEPWRDPGTCARTVTLVAPSGRACFTLAVDGTDACDNRSDEIWPDGTLVLQTGVPNNSCLIKWWPGLARPGHWKRTSLS
jgi:hypothetical protein